MKKKGERYPCFSNRQSDYIPVERVLSICRIMEGRYKGKYLVINPKDHGIDYTKKSLTSHKEDGNIVKSYDVPVRSFRIIVDCILKEN